MTTPEDTMLLLDTHAFIWLASAPDQLSEPARAAIHHSAAALTISVVSSWEIALLHKRGRLQLPMPADTFIGRALGHHGITELPLGRETVFRATALPDIHNDPFDRVLIAEALIHKAPLVSKDRQIARYPGLKVIW